MLNALNTDIPINDSLAAVDTDKLIWVKYIGSQESATVEAAATTGDLTFKHGVAGSEAVDSTIGSSGVFDLSAAAYDTWALIEAAINASSNWRAVKGTARYSDNSESSAGNGKFAAAGIAAAQAKVQGGVGLTADSALAGIVGLTIGNKDVDGNTDVGRIFGFDQVSVTITNAASTAASLLVRLIAVDYENQTERILYTGTYVTATLLLMNKDDWGPETLWAKPGESLLVQAVEGAGGTPAITAVQIDAIGRYKMIGSGKVETFMVSDL